MPEPTIREVFEMITKQTEPDKDSWKEQEERQRRAARNRRVGTYALVAAVIAGIAVVIALVRPGRHVQPAGHATNPAGSLQVTRQDTIVVGLDAKTLATVPGLPADAFALSLSPDASRIAFVTGGTQDTIATIGIDGGQTTLLGPGNQPALSPDGSEIAFVYQNSIWTMNSDGSARTKLTYSSFPDEFPQWSPDGRTIVYDNLGAATPLSGFTTTSEIMTIPVTGGSPNLLTKNHVADSEPAYSPDGRSIAFRRSGVIWVMNADGTHAHRVSSMQAEQDVPRWSPDGRWIAFTRYVGNPTSSILIGTDHLYNPAVEDVWLLNVSSGRLTRVGGLGMATFLNTPQWFPNSRELLLNVVRSSHS
jgi:Tol biopolymer transport system component